MVMDVVKSYPQMGISKAIGERKKKKGKNEEQTFRSAWQW